MEQHPEPFTGADFLPQPDEDDEGDGADAMDDTDVVPVHPMFAGGVVTGMGPMRGHGAKVPDAITNLFKANEGV
jgi:hypothetical protein